MIDYVIKNSKNLNIDINKIILAGDSAGGNAAMVMSKRLAKETKIRPIFQVLIYPWVQFPSSRLPSAFEFIDGMLSAIDFTKSKLWYLGYKDITDEMKEAILSNNHTLLLNEKEKEIFNSYLNVDLIPQKYKTNKKYYETSKSIPLINTGTLEPNNILVRDKNFAQKLRLLFSEEVSPGLASLEQLKLQPKTYQITCEWDSLKDEGLILSERLKQAGVNVEVAFYDQCFHGMVSNLDKYSGFKHSHVILKDLLKYMSNNLLE